MGAAPFAAIMRELLDWMSEHREQAALQDGGATRADTLGDLDERFFKAEREKPFYDFARPWIAGLEALEVVPNERYGARLDAATAANPLAGEREMDGQIRALGAQLSDPTQQGLILCCATATPPLAYRGLGSGHVVTVAGTQTVMWRVLTDQGGFDGCLVEGQGAALLHPTETKPDGSPRTLSGVAASILKDVKELAAANSADVAAVVLARQRGSARSG